MDQVVAEARSRGYTETLFGRRRQIPELQSSTNYRIRQAGERQAMNAGIQGLAADIFKVALVRLDHALEDDRRWPAGWSCRSTTRSSSRCRRTRRTSSAKVTLAAMTGAARSPGAARRSTCRGATTWADAKG